MSPRVIVSRFWGSLTKRRRDAELDDEIQQHLDLLTEEFVGQGLPRDAARRRARREFGGAAAIADATRDVRGFPFLASIVQDARFALRQLRRSPGFAAAAILTLAIGIGGTTAILCVLDVVAFRPLSYPDADRLVSIQEQFAGRGQIPVSAADTEVWRREVRAFDRIALVFSGLANLTGQGEPERLVIGHATPALLPMLGATPERGRLLRDEEDRDGSDRVVVLSHAFWHRRFNDDPGVVGRTVTLDGVPHVIVGVLPARFHAPNVKHLFPIPVPEMVVDLWKPLVLAPEDKPAIGRYSFVAVAHLAPGATLEQARTELSASQAELVHRIVGKGNIGTAVAPLQEQLASRSRESLQLLLAAVATVLLVGCVNIANLLLARVVARQKELAVRQAIGAGPARLARQIAVENLLLGVLGAIGGLAVARIAIAVIVRIAPPDVPRLDEVALDYRMLTFALAVSLVCGATIGAVAVWRTRRPDLHSLLKGREGTQSHPASTRLKRMLVGAEFGLSTACVAVALLLAHSFLGLLHEEKGFRSEGVLTVGANLAGARYADDQARHAFAAAIIDDLAHRPGVTAVAAASQLPLTGTGSLSALSPDGTTLNAVERQSADVRSVTTDYLHVFGIPLRAGRFLTDADRDQHVAVLSAQLAARAWPGQDPLGRRFRFGTNPREVLYEVVGIAGDVRGTTLEQPPTSTAYIPFPQRAASNMSFAINLSRDAADVIPEVRRAIRSRDAAVPIERFRMFDRVIDESLAPRRFQLWMVVTFAGLAALLASLGVYGVLSYTVAQRYQEIGVRIALGARPRAVLSAILAEVLLLAGAGLVVAIPIVFAAGSSLRAFLYGVRLFDPSAMATAAALMAAVAVAAGSIPGFRASRVDPMVALRSE